MRKRSFGILLAIIFETRPSQVSEANTETFILSTYIIISLSGINPSIAVTGQSGKNGTFASAECAGIVGKPSEDGHTLSKNTSGFSDFDELSSMGILEPHKSDGKSGMVYVCMVQRTSMFMTIKSGLDSSGGMKPRCWVVCMPNYKSELPSTLKGHETFENAVPRPNMF